MIHVCQRVIARQPSKVNEDFGCRERKESVPPQNSVGCVTKKTQVPKELPKELLLT
jgi:hypothetical protein